MDTTRTKVFLLYLTVMVLTCSGQEGWDCSKPCTCKWVSGKKTAECIKQNLTEIPAILSPEIQNLDLTGNRINHLIHDAFSRLNLVNLHKLVLRDCGIESIHTDAFNGLEIVIEIDLSFNNIKALYPGTFDETRRLRVLLLNQNQLQTLENGLFHDLVYLQKVALSDNKLETIGDKTFRNLTGLQTLTLDGNNLSYLKLDSFDDLPKLGSLELRNNPWNCNCYLKRFRDWTIARKLYTKPTTCQQPGALAGKMWDEIGSDEFACRPKIVAIGPATRLEIGRGDLRLWCKATGTPKPKITWIHRSKTLNNLARRHNERGYILSSNGEWLNLTIPDVGLSDKGEYICMAKSPGGSTERNVSLSVVGETHGGKDNFISLPLALGLGVTAVLLLLVTMTLCACYCRRRRVRHDEKSSEAVSLEHHGLGEQEKSLITAINPVVKPPRRYEAPSVTSHGTEMTELNRTLLDNDSVFADGVNSTGIGGVVGGMAEDERERSTPELDCVNGSMIRTTSYRQYPPDLLAFSAGRNASPTSQASTAPDNTRLPSLMVPYGSPTSSSSHQHQQQLQHQQQQQQQQQQQHPTAFKTLPHNRSGTPFTSGAMPVLPRHGYVTIPRRPRAPSWSNGPPNSTATSPNDSLSLGPVYDNLGLRTTADGSSVLSLNKSPEPNLPGRGRNNLALASAMATPTSLYGTIQRSTPNILANSPLDRSAPEGAAEWPTKLMSDELDLEQNLASPANASTPLQHSSNTLGRKIAPRPPPKPKKKSSNDPTLYEDEGEDGTEV